MIFCHTLVVGLVEDVINVGKVVGMHVVWIGNAGVNVWWFINMQ
jgi:hypothetical protein